MGQDQPDGPDQQPLNIANPNGPTPKEAVAHLVRGNLRCGEVAEILIARFGLRYEDAMELVMDQIKADG